MCTEDQLQALVDRFIQAKTAGQLDDASEETIRMWINELLNLFDWDVRNTHQVLQERRLDRASKERLREIESTNNKPDYTLVNGDVHIAYLDAKSLDVNIETDARVAFQIRSYGWSAGTLFSFVTNFEEFAIYDCTVKPSVNDSASIARAYYFQIGDYVANLATLSTFLYRKCAQNYPLIKLSTPGVALDNEFANYLRDFRIKLVNDILSNGLDYGLESLSVWSQIIIDRIIFIRVCEARGLEKDGLLKEYQRKGFWNCFKKSSYMDFYKHYDGPIFKRIKSIEALTISDAVFDELLANLYYPSPYRFDVIPIHVLSSIYELFLGYRLELFDGIVTSSLKESLKKQNGVVVTPLHIVRNVLDRTFCNSRIERANYEELLTYRVLDPACGSGIFIVEAFSRLEQYAINALQPGDNRIITVDGKPLLNLSTRKQIAKSCLYGVDIDPEAVEVTRLSIALRLIDDYAPEVFGDAGLLGSMILSGIGDNIKCGNSLVSSDILSLFPKLSENLDELKATNVFDWRSSFPEIFDLGGFDYVIGNPPYVEVKNYNVGLPTMANYLKSRFPSSKNGKIDLAIPFIEQGVSLLNEDGRLGYIVQKRFFKTMYGKKIREIIADGQFLNSVYDYLETDLFPGRITYVAILVCDKNVDNNSLIQYDSSEEGSSHIEFPQAFAREPVWDFSNPELTNWRIQASNTLGILENACSIRVGLQVLYDGIYQIKQAKIKGNLVEGNTESGTISIEKGACRPLLCNEEFKPLCKPGISTFAIFPYRVKKGDVERIKFPAFSKAYPKAGQYLLANKTILSQKVELYTSVHHCDKPDDYWHFYTREQNHKEYSGKVCVPMTSQNPSATVVLDGRTYCDNANMYFITIDSQSSETKLYALAGIINSSWFATLAKSIANPQQNGYYKFNKQFLDPLPFPCSKFANEDDDIKGIATLAKRIESISNTIQKNPALKGNYHNALTALWGELDTMVEKVYGVSGTSILSHRQTREDRI